MTAMVSPRARPRPSMSADHTRPPIRQHRGANDFPRVAPSASAASMWSRGVCAKTSREIAETMGKIMMASTTEATNTDPLGSTFSLSSGIQPSLLVSHSAAGARNGPRTISPHRPKMMDDRREQVDYKGDRA